MFLDSIHHSKNFKQARLKPHTWMTIYESVGQTWDRSIDQLRVYVRSEAEASDMDEEYFDEFDRFGEDDDEDGLAVSNEDEDLDPGLEE